MPPRIAFWTSSFETRMEAVASEVSLLRQNFPSSVSWGLNSERGTILSWKNGFCLHPRLHLLFRATTRLLEPCFQINHIFGSLGDWFYLTGHKIRPTILTAAAVGNPVDKRLLDRVDRFVVEHPAGRKIILDEGVDNSRIRLILPPVDLNAFRPTVRTHKRFTVLFASSPDNREWLKARGIPQLLDAAALCPDILFRILWRPWGNSLETVREWIKIRSLQNVELHVGRVNNMAEQYQFTDVTVIPFTDSTRCKPAPNSLIESLACGRPVVCSQEVGLAELVENSGAGIVADVNGQAINKALEQIQSNWNKLSIRARSAAEKHFDQRMFISAHEHLYTELLTNNVR